MVAPPAPPAVEMHTPKSPQPTQLLDSRVAHTCCEEPATPAALRHALLSAVMPPTRATVAIILPSTPAVVQSASVGVQLALQTAEQLAASAVTWLAARTAKHP